MASVKQKLRTQSKGLENLRNSQTETFPMRAKSEQCLNHDFSVTYFPSIQLMFMCVTVVIRGRPFLLYKSMNCSFGNIKTQNEKGSNVPSLTIPKWSAIQLKVVLKRRTNYVRYTNTSTEPFRLSVI